MASDRIRGEPTNPQRRAEPDTGVDRDDGHPDGRHDHGPKLELEGPDAIERPHGSESTSPSA